MKRTVPKSPFATRLSGSAKETELRIRNIFQWKKGRPSVGLILIAVLIVFSCGTLVSCNIQEEIDEPLVSSPVVSPEVTADIQPSAGSVDLKYGSINFITNETEMQLSYPVYGYEYPFGQGGPLFEITTELQNQMVGNFFRFLTLLYGEEDVTRLKIEERETVDYYKWYVVDKTEFVSHVNSISIMPENFTFTSYEELQTNPLLVAAVKYLDLKQPEVTSITRYKLDGSVSQYCYKITESTEVGLTDSLKRSCSYIEVTKYADSGDVILQIRKIELSNDGEVYEVIPLEEAAAKIQTEYPAVNTENLKAEVFYGAHVDLTENRGYFVPYYRCYIENADGAQEYDGVRYDTIEIPMVDTDAIGNKASETDSSGNDKSITREIYRCDDVYIHENTPTHGKGTVYIPEISTEYIIEDCKFLLCDDGCDPASVVSRASQGYAPAYFITMADEFVGNYRTMRFTMEVPEPMIDSLKQQGSYDSVLAQLARNYFYLVELDNAHYAYIHVVQSGEENTVEELENEAIYVDEFIKSLKIEFSAE